MALALAKTGNGGEEGLCTVRVNTKVVIDIGTNEVLERESYEYSGPIEHAGGGPSQEQIDAANRQAALSQQQGQIAAENAGYERAQRNKISPYATSLMEKGLAWLPAAMDISGATSARALAPGRADIMRATSRFPNLPSGYRDQLLADYNASAARNWEDSMIQNLLLNEQAKQAGAALLTNQMQLSNGLGWYGGAASGNTSVMNAPLQRPGIGGVLGGILGGALGVGLGAMTGGASMMAGPALSSVTSLPLQRNPYSSIMY